MSFKVYFFKASPEIDWSEYWHNYDVAEHFALIEAETTLSVVLKYLPQNGVILDAGCGLGRWTQYLRQRGYRVVGLDKSLEGLKAGRDHAPSLPVVCASVLETPFPKESFDGAICFGLVEHFEGGPADALAELHRILTQGGFLLVSVPYNNLVRRLLVNPLYGLRNLKRRLLGYQLAFNEYRFSARELSHFLRESGFDVIACYPDEFKPPRCKGLFVDARSLQGGLRPTTSWELGSIAKRLRGLLDSISPWLCCGGVLCVAKRVTRTQPATTCVKEPNQ